MTDPKKPDLQALSARDKLARAIAQNGFGREWGDFLPVNAHDTDHGDLLEYAGAALAALPGIVPPLVWDVDSRRVRFDDTMMMGHGYDWDGFVIMREESHCVGYSYAIWPDHISSDQYSLYCTLDGLYIQSLNIEAAKAAANAHHAAQLMAGMGLVTEGQG